MCGKNIFLSYINVYFTNIKTTGINNTDKTVQEQELCGDLCLQVKMVKMVKKGKNVFGYGLKSKTGVLGKFAIKHFE